MSYITKSDLLGVVSETDLIRLTDVTGNTATEVNSEVLSVVITQSEAEVNGYASAKYITPLSSVDNIIKTITCDVVIYRLKKRRGNVTESDHEAYKMAVKKLEDLRNGKIKLTANVIDIDNITATNNDSIAIKNNGREIFSSGFTRAK